MQQTHPRPAHGSRLPCPPSSIHRQISFGERSEESSDPRCVQFLCVMARIQKKFERGSERGRNERCERERTARDAQSHLTTLLCSPLQELYNLGYVASQARYILQYIQTFTVDTLTIWQTVATGQRQAFRQKHAFQENSRIHWDLRLLFVMSIATSSSLRVNDHAWTLHPVAVFSEYKRA